MKQTFKRVLSIVLSLLMLISMLSVYAFAVKNYEPDDEYYDRAYLDSVIVNTKWAKNKDGDTISYNYRGNKITEIFDSETHFSSIQAAYDYCVKMGQNCPSIILTEGMHSENLVLKTGVTLLGPNAGINPNVVNEDDPTAPWSAAKRKTEAVLKGVIAMDANTNIETEVTIDGFFLYSGFAYIDPGTNPVGTSVILRNSTATSAGSITYNGVVATSIIYFGATANKANSAYVKNVRATNMNSSSVVGSYADLIEIDGLYYGDSGYPAVGYAGAYSDQNPEYVIKNSMFYNNNSKDGLINVDTSLKDGTKRLYTKLDVFDCVFVDGKKTPTTEDFLSVASPIQCTIAGAKNSVNVHDCIFKANKDYIAPAIKFNYTETAVASVLSDIKFNDNKLYGFVNLPSAEEVKEESRLDLSSNYYADSKGVQCDPVYPNEASVTTIKVDYFWLDEEMTMPNSAYNITSIGVPGTTIKNHIKQVTATIDYGKSYDVSIKTPDENTKYTLYDQLGKEVTKIDSTELISGAGKNVFYAVGTNSNFEGYESVYTVVITTYDPDKAVMFDLEDQYMLTTNVANMNKGDIYYQAWDDIIYKFVVGETVFADISDIYAACDAVPTVLIPAGTYTSNIKLTGSAVLLGAKHGINPNVPQFDSPDIAWEKNPERANEDQETIFENCVVYIADDVENATVTLDGFTFGSKSGYYDRGENVVTYTTTIVKNVIIDEAGGVLFYNEALGSEILLPYIFTFGTGADTMSANHKYVRFVNTRMTDQSNYYFTGDVFENIVFDGFYYANNTTSLHDTSWRASAKQNFYMEVRNSKFFESTPSRVFSVDFSKTNASSSMYNRLVLNNNIFYEAATNSYGIFAVIFASSRDSLRFKNNFFLSSVCDSIIPGNTTYFLGKTIIPTPDENGKTEYEPETVNDVVISHNRVFGCIAYVNQASCVDDGACWDYSYNFFSSSKKYSKTVAGTPPTSRSGTLSTCYFYYTDYDMTKLNAHTANGDKSEFDKELNYHFNGSGTVNANEKTYVDSVPAYVDTYDFGIVLDSLQATYGIYSDEACTVAVEEPVQLVPGVNNFYIKFASFDGSTTEVYNATITKAARTAAIVKEFGDAQITENEILAIVPVGTSTYELPAVVISDGASYKIYDDANCTTEFAAATISDVGTTPVKKYVKVTAEDGKTEKVYTLSVAQSEANQGALIAIPGADRISATEFEAVLPAGVATFNLEAVCSEGATVTSVLVDNIEVRPVNYVYIINNVLDSKTVTIEVTSATGAKNTYTLKVTKDVTSCGVISIDSMIPYSVEDNCFEAVVSTGNFKVVPTLENASATFKVYTDRECTKVCRNDTVSLKTGDNVAYLKVTSADGLSTKIYTLNIKNVGEAGAGGEFVEGVYSVVDAEFEPITGIFCIAADENISEYELKFELLNDYYDRTTYKLYADNYQTPITDYKKITSSTKLKVSTMATLVYVEVRISAGAGSDDIVEKFRVMIESPRPKATYKDYSNISSWAKAQVDYLNDNGCGFFEGDQNGNFNPKSNITRFEVAAIAVRVLGVNAENFSKVELPFKDKIPNWASNYVKACYSLGIMNGVSNTEFNGSASTTRQEFAKIIVSVVVMTASPDLNANLLYNTGKATIDAAYNAMNFADDANVSSWAVPYIRLAVSTFELMNGSSENGKLYINPKKPITRQEVAILIANYFGYEA